MGLFSNKPQVSEADFPRLARELAQGLKETRSDIFHLCIELLEAFGAFPQETELTPELELGLTSFQLVHVQVTAVGNGYLEQGSNVWQFLDCLLTASCQTADDREKAEAYMGHWGEFHNREVAGDNQKEEGETDNTYDLLLDWIVITVLGELQWRTCEPCTDLAVRAGIHAGVYHIITGLILLTKWKTAITFGDKKGAKGFEKRMDQWL